MKQFSIADLLQQPVIKKAAYYLIPYRLWINVAIHIFLFSLSYVYSVLLTNGLILDETAWMIIANSILPVVLLRTIVFCWHDLFQGMWRFVSFEDLINIIRSVVISSLIFYLSGLIWSRISVAEEIYILDLTFCILFCGGIRSLVRNFRERYFRGRIDAAQKKIILIGPLDRIQPLLKDLISDPLSGYLPLAIIDPEKTDNAGITRLCDVPVISMGHLLSPRKNRFGAVEAIVICWPGGTRKQLDHLIDQMKNLSIPFKTIPHFNDIIGERVSVNDIREVEIEDLLERPPVHIEMAKINAYLKGKTILVTGGAGSIGSEICRQVAPFKPNRLIVVERSENSLNDLILEFRRRFPQTPFTGVVSSVNDSHGLKTIMTTHKVDVVFHAAAYKHVPLMEDAPIESAYNNIEGTYNTAMAALEAGVQRFVMISTDKSVNPTNVMGVTKRIAEMIVQSASNNQTRFMTVRFGNVLGSAGSVIPIFKKQIAMGGPLTVTHADIERFFMTIPEAVQLVLQAGCMGRGGEIFVLDMGQPVKILKLAERLITLSGKTPYEDIDIVFTGLRPGEKMYEELFNVGEKLRPTTHSRIKVAESNPVEKDYIVDQVRSIQSLVRAKDKTALQAKFRSLVPGYCCTEPGPEPSVQKSQKGTSNDKRKPSAPPVKPVLPTLVTD